MSVDAGTRTLEAPGAGSRTLEAPGAGSRTLEAPGVGSRTLEAPGAGIVYDARGPLPTAEGRPPLLLIGQPMEASGFAALASHFPDRTVVTYDPRGLGRSTRSDGRTDHDPQ